MENSGKAILMLFGISPKTHEPTKHLAHLLKKPEIPEPIRLKINGILPDFLLLGMEEHLMTDYGDESTYTLPWDIFDEESARSSLDAARSCKISTEQIINLAQKWRSEKKS